MSERPSRLDTSSCSKIASEYLVFIDEQAIRVFKGLHDRFQAFQAVLSFPTLFERVNVSQA